MHEIRELEKIDKDLPLKVLKLLTQKSRSSVAIIDRNGKFLYANEYTYKMLGYAKEEFMTIPAYKHSKMITKPIFQDLFDKAQKLENVIYQTRRKTKTGELIPMEAYMHAVTIDNNPYVFVISFDISERIKYSKTLQEIEARFRRLAETVPVHIWVTDTNKEFIYTNTALNDYFNLNHDITREEWESKIHQEDKTEFIKLFNHNFKLKKEFHYEIRIENEDGKYEWFLFKGVPRYIEEEEFRGFIGTLTNITYRKEEEERKDEFLKIASHELKTPLTSLQGYIQILDRIIKPAKNILIKEYMFRVNTHLERLNDLITNLLDTTKIQAGYLPLVKVKFDFDTLVKEAIESIQVTTDTHTIIKSGNVAIEVEADRDKIYQVLYNLLNNAIKYSPDADKIIVKVSKTKLFVEVAITDFGIGITDSDMVYVFERFHRGRQTELFPGVGIGLYLAKEIIERHGGKIWAKSTPKVGSTFYFKIPIKGVEQSKI